MLAAEFPGRNPGFSLAENTDDLFVGKSLLHGDVLMWLMKTLLTSRCINQRGAGQFARLATREPVRAHRVVLSDSLPESDARRYEKFFGTSIIKGSVPSITFTAGDA